MMMMVQVEVNVLGMWLEGNVVEMQRVGWWKRITKGWKTNEGSRHEERLTYWKEKRWVWLEEHVWVREDEGKQHEQLWWMWRSQELQDGIIYNHA
jgi:hypothetical protein